MSTTWSRRARTIPAAVVATALLTALLPLWLPMVTIADLVRGRVRLPLARCGLFALQYGFNLVVEVLLAPVLWLAAGFGRRLDRPRWVARHHRLVMWSARLMVRRAEQLLGLRVEFDDTDALFDRGPVIVLCRHVSVADAAVPPLVFDRVGFRGVGLFTDDMLVDPAMDLIYQRAGHVFIDRAGGDDVLPAVASMVGRLDSTAAATIYPEGRLFRADRLTRALADIAVSDPDRADRLAGLRHLLPPRPAGVLTLLDAGPTLDVVVLGHVGLEGRGAIDDLLARAPVDITVEAFGRRIPRSEIPTTEPERERWLDDVWLDLDEGIDERIGRRGETRPDSASRDR